jgi:hypothetical protein
MGAILTTDDPGEAERACRWAPRSFVQSGAPPWRPRTGPLHEVWADGGRDGEEGSGRPVPGSPWLAGEIVRVATHNQVAHELPTGRYTVPDVGDDRCGFF